MDHLSRPSILCALGGIVLLSLLGGTTAQNACPAGTIFTIGFPEYATNEPTPVGDARYVVPLVNDTSESAVTITVEADPQGESASPVPFSEYFSGYFSSDIYYVRLDRGLDRDGSTDSVIDDLSLLQYRLICVENNDAFVQNFYVLKIEINDINDNAPEFLLAPYSVTIDELFPIGATIFTGISAFDIDEGNNRLLEFDLANGERAMFDAEEFFAVSNVYEGTIVVASHLDFDSMYRLTNQDAGLTYFNLTVIATDKGDPPLSSSTSLIITISDADDLGPEFLYNGCLSSSDQGGDICVLPKYKASLQTGISTMLQMTPEPGDDVTSTSMIVQDRDTLNSTIVCSLLATQPTGYENSFNVTTVQIGATKQYGCQVFYNGASPHYASEEPLSVIIKAQEQNSQGYAEFATVEVTIRPVNLYAPVLSINSSVGYIEENSPIATFVLDSSNDYVKISFSDSDTELPLESEQGYDYIVTPDGPFGVSAEGFVVLVEASLDFEGVTSYVMNVTAKDRTLEQRESQPVTIAITVTNDREEDEFYEAKIDPGSYTLSTGRLVELGSGTYAFADPLPASGVSFVIDPDNRLVIQGTVLAGELYHVYVDAVSWDKTPQRYKIQVTVNVTGSPADVTDVTQNFTRLAFTAQNYMVPVSEAVPAGSNIFTLQARDPDDSGLVYSVIDYNPGNVTFTTNGAFLVNEQQFDRETTDEHVVTVQVQNSEGDVAQAIVTLQILDVNDNNPEFSTELFESQVLENSPANTLVITVRANDADLADSENSPVRYSILPGLGDTAFYIISETGQLYTSAVLDREVQASYTVIVEATDLGDSPRTSVAMVSVTVEDVEDEFPLFEELDYTTHVDEGDTVGITVLTVQATDADEVKDVVYQLENIPGRSDANSLPCLPGVSGR